MTVAEARRLYNHEARMAAFDRRQGRGREGLRLNDFRRRVSYTEIYRRYEIVAAAKARLGGRGLSEAELDALPAPVGRSLPSQPPEEPPERPHR